MLAWLIACLAFVACCSDPPADPTPAGTSPVAPAERAPAEIPPAAGSYMGREIAETMHWLGAEWLMRETRESEEHASEMLAVLDVKTGQTVCDFGCGNGFHTLRLAELVGAQGSVLAVDIQPQMLDLLRVRAARAGLDNVEPILGTAVDAGLPAGSCDLILLVDVYHELSHPEAMLRELRTALKPDGRLVLVEFRAEDPDVPIKPLHKMSKAQILKELVPNGFRLAAQYDELPWQHVMFFARDDRAVETGR